MMADKIAKENPYAVRDQLAFYIQKSWDAFPILRLQNIQEILKPKEKDTDFEKLVKKRIVETRKKLNFTN